MRARLALYKSGALPIHKIEAPVISIGNITAGGTGKTPLVAWMAQAVARLGLRVCILSRGYGRRNPQARVLVSDSARVLADAREGGDEPRMLAEMLQGLAAVISDADRVSAARWAIEHLASELFILDDGFQHLRLARDLNIVTLDATNPWGGKRLLPGGLLREPLNGLARADCIIITRADMAADIEALRAEAKRLSGGRPIFLSHLANSRVRPLLETPSEQGDNTISRQRPAGAFCALGNPQAFFSQAIHSGYTLNYTRAFTDHHVYTQADADALAREARSRGASVLLTTAKDAVKLRSLRFEMPCFVLEVQMRFDDEEGLRRMISETVSKRG